MVMFTVSTPLENEFRIILEYPMRFQDLKWRSPGREYFDMIMRTTFQLLNTKRDSKCKILLLMNFEAS